MKGGGEGVPAVHSVETLNAIRDSSDSALEDDDDAEGADLKREAQFDFLRVLNPIRFRKPPRRPTPRPPPVIVTRYFHFKGKNFKKDIQKGNE